MIDGIGNNPYAGTVSRPAGTDSMGVSAPGDERSARPQDAEDTPIRPAQQPSEPSRLDTEALEQIRELKRRDQEVRAHERAHMAAGGQYIRGGAQYSYQYGPDGKRYAVGGEVSIDVSPVPDNPELTLRKAQVIKRAALAPAQPSAQDRSVAAQAQQMIIRAQSELARERMQEIRARQQGDETPRAPAPPNVREAGSPFDPGALTLAEPEQSVNLDEVV